MNSLLYCIFLCYRGRVWDICTLVLLCPDHMYTCMKTCMRCAMGIVCHGVCVQWPGVYHGGSVPWGECTMGCVVSLVYIVHCMFTLCTLYHTILTQNGHITRNWTWPDLRYKLPVSVSIQVTATMSTATCTCIGVVYIVMATFPVSASNDQSSLWLQTPNVTVLLDVYKGQCHFTSPSLLGLLAKIK